MSQSKPLIPEDPSLDPYYRKPTYEVFSRQVRKYRTNDNMTVKKAITLNLEEYLSFENVPFDYRTFDIRLFFAFLAVACGVGSFYGPIPFEYLLPARIGAVIVYNIISLFMLYLAKYVETDAFFISSPLTAAKKNSTNAGKNYHRRVGASANNAKSGDDTSILAPITDAVNLFKRYLFYSEPNARDGKSTTSDKKDNGNETVLFVDEQEALVKPSMTYRIPLLMGNGGVVESTSVNNTNSTTIVTTAGCRAMGPQRVATLGELLRGHRVRFGVKMNKIFDSSFVLVVELLDAPNGTADSTTPSAKPKNSKKANASSVSSTGSSWYDWLKPPKVLKRCEAAVDVSEIFDQDGYIFPPRLRMTLDAMLVQLVSSSS